VSVTVHDTMTGKFCWTCGDQKALHLFSTKLDEYDGLAAECKRCEECREMARQLDGATAPRRYEIEGEGRTQAPLSFGRDRLTLGLNSMLRRRPRSGLMSAEGV
jgi:hypothetical protein